MLTNQDNSFSNRPLRHRKEGGDDRRLFLRNVLNIIFMIGALIGVVLYFQVGHDVGTIVILVSMVFKIVECVFRFMK